MTDISELIAKIADTEEKLEAAKKKKAAKRTTKVYLQLFCDTYKTKYSDGYAVRGAIEVNIIKKLMELYDHEKLCKMIRLYVSDYEKLPWVKTDKYPRPHLGAMSVFANSLAALIKDDDEEEEGYVESDGITF